VNLTVLPGEFSVWRLDSDAPLPEIEPRNLVSITRTASEVSIVCSSEDVPPGGRAEHGWRCLRVEGPLAFELIGVLASLSAPLAAARIPVFVISTFDTDYLLVKSVDLTDSCQALRQAGHTVEE
jgi:hypothetical protein